MPSSPNCKGDHDYSVVREDERELGIYVLCAKCGDYRLVTLPIPSQVREGMGSETEDGGRR